MRLTGVERAATGAVLLTAAVLAVCAVGFGIWATLTGNSAAVGMAGVYSFVLAALVTVAGMIGWAVRHHAQAGLASAVDTRLSPPLVERTAGGRVPAGSPAATDDTPVVVGEIPQEPPGFQPRADMLAAFEEPGPHSRVSVVHAVTGMRGVGKTHLAAAYARARLSERWRLVAWINAEDIGGVLAGLTATAAALGLGDSGGDAAAGLAVRHRLEVDGHRCLLVFDNATDPALLRPFIPAVGVAQVIITSNQQSMADLGAGVPVEVFSEQEALAFLTERTGRQDADGALALTKELGCLPLALAQAAAVIADQHLDYSTYLDRLRRKPVDELLTPVSASQYPRGVAAAVLLSLDRARAGDDSGVCQAVMNLLAVLSPAGIRRAFIHAAGELGVLGSDSGPPEAPREVVDRALARLAGTSLLTFSVDGSAVSAHRLVARVVREQLVTEGKLTAVCTAASRLLDAQAELLRDNWHENRAAVRDLVEQIMALQESSGGDPAGGELARDMIRLRCWAFGLLYRLGDSVAQCILIGEPLLADQEHLLGPDHPNTLESRGNLAEAYRAAGQNAKAITLIEQNLDREQRVLGPDHPGTLNSRGNLALAYQDDGRLAEAVELHEQNVADRERVQGTDDPDTLNARNNLAEAYRDDGRFAEAVELHERNLADRERVLGGDHPDTLESRANLAEAYRDGGRLAEAVVLHERNLADCERVLGADHPDTLTARRHLAEARAVPG